MKQITNYIRLLMIALGNFIIDGIKYCLNYLELKPKQDVAKQVEADRLAKLFAMNQAGDMPDNLLWDRVEGFTSFTPSPNPNNVMCGKCKKLPAVWNVTCGFPMCKSCLEASIDECMKDVHVGNVIEIFVDGPDPTEEEETLIEAQARIIDSTQDQAITA